MASKPPAFKSALKFGSGQLTYCLARIAEQQQLLTLVKAALPVELAPNIEHCVLSGNKLIIYTRTAAWASQIRFFQQVILNKLQESGQRNIGALQVKLLLGESLPQKKRAKVLPARAVVQSLVGQTAVDETDKLAAALNRLGKTLQKRLLQGSDEDTFGN